MCVLGGGHASHVGFRNVKDAMSTFFADKIATQLKPKYVDVRVCLDGELVEQRNRLHNRMRQGGSAAESAFGHPLENSLKEVNERIDAATITIRITAVSAHRWVEAVIANPMAEDPAERFPGDTEQGCSIVGLTFDLLPESARIRNGDDLERLTAAEWEQIGNTIDFGEFTQLISGVVQVNMTSALVNQFELVDEVTAGKA